VADPVGLLLGALGVLEEEPVEEVGNGTGNIAEVHFATIEGQCEGAETVPQTPLAGGMAGPEPLDVKDKVAALEGLLLGATERLNTVALAIATAQYDGTEVDQAMHDGLAASADHLVLLGGQLAAATEEAKAVFEGGDHCVGQVPMAEYDPGVEHDIVGELFLEEGSEADEEAEHGPAFVLEANAWGAGWRKFFAQREELMGKHYSLNSRMRLFHGTVTPTVLYGCEAWTMTATMENRLRRVQRQMLRMILQMPRRRHAAGGHRDGLPQSSDNSAASTDDEQIPDHPVHECDDDGLEPWADWIRRATKKAEEVLTRLKVADWVSIQRQRKWKWAQKVLLLSDNSSWMVQALLWDPEADLDCDARRHAGRPKKRWSDDLRQSVLSEPRYAEQEWSDVARTDVWRTLEGTFVNR